MNRLLFMAEVFCCTLLGYGAAQGVIYALGADTANWLHPTAVQTTPAGGSPPGALCTPDSSYPGPSPGASGVHSRAEAGIKRGSGGSARRPRLPVTP